LKRYKSLDTDQIPVELLKTGGEILYIEMHRFIRSLWNGQQLPQQWKESINVRIYKNCEKGG
jgi:hypothetical protein